MALLRRLFVTVSELWLSLIGSIRTPGAFLKTNRKETRKGDDGKEREDGRNNKSRQKESRGGETVASLCSAAGELKSPLGS